jgi:hypothetical protein
LPFIIYYHGGEIKHNVIDGPAAPIKDEAYNLIGKPVIKIPLGRRGRIIPTLVQGNRERNRLIWLRT